MYTLVGNGRVARHFAHYFEQLDIAFNQWYRQAPYALVECLQGSTHVLLLIPDQQIDGFIEQHASLLQNHTLIHCSGSLTSARAHEAHPLMTFSHTFYSLPEYKSIPFVLTKEGPTFESLFPKLPNPHVYISAQDKSYYHALCVMANNFSTMLWDKVFGEFEQRFGFSKEILLPILERTFKNIAENPHAALTGPLVRQDHSTIENNLRALSNDNFLEIYRAFLNTYLTNLKEKETL